MHWGVSAWLCIREKLAGRPEHTWLMFCDRKGGGVEGQGVGRQAEGWDGAGRGDQVHLTQPRGDVLVFLTGQEEIESCEELLKQVSSWLGPPATSFRHGVASLHRHPHGHASDSSDCRRAAVSSQIGKS